MATTRTNSKYTSLNFNDIYEKKSSSSGATTTTAAKSPSSSSLSSNKSYSLSASSRLNGMLVLSRPSPPKPLLPSPPLSPSPKPPSPLTHVHRPVTPTSTSDRITTPDLISDPISLRPQGKTGTGGGVGVLSSFPNLERENSNNNKVGIKSDKFVPPHLRPGFVAREQKPVPPPPAGGGAGGNRLGNFRPGSGGHGHGNYGSMMNNRSVDQNGRPKSGGGGGGYDKRMRGGGISVGVGESDRGELTRPRSGGSGTRPSSTGCAD